MIRIKQATAKGWIECREGGVADLGYPTSKTRRGRVQEGGNICPTITAAEGALYRMSEKKYRIRKLTPRECWRLMGFSTNKNGVWIDDCYEKAEAVNSNTQLYKQAGNSIVVDCLEAIFKNLPIREDVTKEEVMMAKAVYSVMHMARGTGTTIRATDEQIKALRWMIEWAGIDEMVSIVEMNDCAEDLTAE